MAETATKLTPNPAVVSQPTKDGAVLLEMTTGDCFELNQVGAEIWDALAKGETLGQVIGTVASRYGLPASTIEADARSLTDDLLKKGLLQSR